MTIWVGLLEDVCEESGITISGRSKFLTHSGTGALDLEGLHVDLGMLA